MCSTIKKVFGWPLLEVCTDQYHVYTVIPAGGGGEASKGGGGKEGGGDKGGGGKEGGGGEETSGGEKTGGGGLLVRATRRD